MTSSAAQPGRLAADEALVACLRAAQFSGMEWERFAMVMVGYGYEVIGGWVRDGSIFRRCRQRGLKGLPLEPPPIDERDVEELIWVTVAEGICVFRQVLRDGGWSATGGATLKTFFIGKCLHRFPGAYQHVRRHLVRPASWVPIDRFDDAQTAANAGQSPDPADQVTGLVDLERRLNALDERDRDILKRRTQGYTYAQIGAELGMTARAVEGRVARVRRQFGDHGGEHEPV